MLTTHLVPVIPGDGKIWPCILKNTLLVRQALSLLEDKKETGARK